jgi:glycerol kinase
MSYVLAIDQGTTSTRALVYDATGRCLGSASKELTQHYPQPGWVEHDALEIWQSVTEVVPRAMELAQVPAQKVVAVGLTNQRETVVIWERTTGRPVARAIVWQDRRTAEFCRLHHHEETWIAKSTGLVLDPYFSASKIRWLLDQDASLRSRAEAGHLACGTIDSWLIWNLTRGKVHATDASNASRTLLLNVKKVCWDDDLCRFFTVPRALLPQVRPSVAHFGTTGALGFLPSGLPITGVAGDQQAALFGQGGFTAGAAKCTYGTGAFFLQHAGDKFLQSRHRLLTSLAAMTNEVPEYVVEGSVFVAGAAVQWLRDGLQMFSAAADVEKMALESDPQQPIVFVPALVGLGAPYWVPEALGTIFGLTRATRREDIARGALEGVALQVADLVEAASKDSGVPLKSLQVDGGMAHNVYFLQLQADLLGIPVIQSAQIEATAQGAAFLAGLQVGLWPGLGALQELIQPGQHFDPRLAPDVRNRRRERWHKAVKAVSDFYV